MKTFAFVTDTHLDEQLPIDNGVDPYRNFSAIIQDIQQRGISEIVFGGDIGEPSSHPFFF